MMKQTLLAFAMMLLLGLSSVNINACEDLPETPLFFIENQGQWNDNVLYQVEMQHARLFLETNQLTYVFLDPNKIDDIHESRHTGIELDNYMINAHAFNVEFVGANDVNAADATCLLPSYRNYYLGSDSEKWASNVSLFEQVDYGNLYNDIDLRFYGDDHHMKYDFIVAPNGNANQIGLRYDGVNELYIQDGKVYAVTSVNTLIENEPYAYQYIDGQLTEVMCNFKINGDVLGFEFPEGYDESQELIIDPVLDFATYTGSTGDNWGFTAAFDNVGNLYAGGIVLGVGYPTTTGAFQINFAGSVDIGITKFTDDGSNLIYSTYLGGSASGEVPNSLISNAEGDLYVLGTTGSNDYPSTSGVYDPSFNGGSFTGVPGISYANGSDIIVTKFNADGTDLEASTFVGGIGNDGVNDPAQLSYNYADEARGEIFVDAENNVYIASCTQSIDFPASLDAYQPITAGDQDGLVLKFNSDLSNLIWGSYIGGSDDDAVYSVKVGLDGFVYVTGGTTSNDFPTTSGAFLEDDPGGSADGFVAKFSNDGTMLLASTYVGTDDYDQSYFVDVDEDGFVYITGQTEGDYPVSPGVYSVPNSGQFIHQFDADLTTTGFSTVFGSGNGGPNLSPTAFLVDKCNQIYVSGWGGITNGGVSTSTTEGLEVTDDAFQSTTDGSDLYFIVLTPDGSDLLYATFFGEVNTGFAGEHVDGGTSRFSKEGIIYHAVCASCGGSNDFPTTAGAWSSNNNSTNCNLGALKFSFDLSPTFAAFSFFAPDITCGSLEVSFDNSSTNADTYQWDFGDGTTSDSENPTHLFDEPGTYTISLTSLKPGTCNEADTSQQVITIFGVPEVVFGDPVCLDDGTQDFTVEMTVNAEDATYSVEVVGGETLTFENGVAQILTFDSAITSYDFNITGNTSGCTSTTSLDSPLCDPCEPDPGTMPTDQQIVCSDGTVSATTTGEIVEDGQQVWYAFHASETAVPGIIFAVNQTGDFTFPSGAEYYEVYYISAVVAFPDATGGPDLEDDCTVVNAGTPVLFLAPVTFEVDESCDFTVGNYMVTFSPQGGYPQLDNSAVYQVTGDFTGEIAFGGSAMTNYEQGVTNTYQFVVTDDGFGCQGTTASEEFYCEKTPIELLRFVGNSSEQGNVLEWSSASEADNDYYTLERSSNGSDFETIGIVSGAGTSNTQNDYQFVDKTPTCGMNYYRLSWTSFNGIVANAANTVALNKDSNMGSGNGVNIYPIPSKEQVQVQFSAVSNSVNTVRLFDLSGKLIQQQTINATDCQAQVNINLQGLKNGMYIVEIANAEGVQVGRIVKQ